MILREENEQYREDVCFSVQQLRSVKECKGTTAAIKSRVFANKFEIDGTYIPLRNQIGEFLCE